jgi:hypothetical protein
LNLKSRGFSGAMTTLQKKKQKIYQEDQWSNLSNSHVNLHIINKKLKINLKMKTWIIEFFYKSLPIVMGYEFVTCGVSILNFGPSIAPSLGLQIDNLRTRHCNAIATHCDWFIVLEMLQHNIRQPPTMTYWVFELVLGVVTQ